MLRWLLGAAGAAVAMFLWGFVFWAVLPLGEASLRTLPDEDAVRDVLRATLTESGAYFLPIQRAGADGMMDPVAIAKHAEGPLVQIFYRVAGAPPLSAAVMVLGLLHGFVAALIAGYLLAGALSSLPTYSKRVAFVTLLGIFAAFVMRIGDTVWLYHPLSYELISSLYVVVNWLLAGLILAAVIKEPVLRKG